MRVALPTASLAAVDVRSLDFLARARDRAAAILAMARRRDITRQPAAHEPTKSATGKAVNAAEFPVCFAVVEASFDPMTTVSLTGASASPEVLSEILSEPCSILISGLL